MAFQLLDITLEKVVISICYLYVGTYLIHQARTSQILFGQDAQVQRLHRNSCRVANPLNVRGVDHT